MGLHSSSFFSPSVSLKEGIKFKEGLKTRVIDLDCHHTSLYLTVPQLISIHLPFKNISWVSPVDGPGDTAVNQADKVPVFTKLAFLWVRLPKPNQIQTPKYIC